MANSITLTSKKHNSRYFELECTQKINGSAENSSTITWKLSAIGDSTYYSTGPTKVIINGVTVYSEERVAWSAGVFPVAQGSKSGTLVVPHTNDGTKKITVGFSTAIYTSTVTEYSDEWTLDPIPRYPSVSQSQNSKTETSITMNWSSDSTIDFVWYSINGGDTWVEVGAVNAKSGTYTINGLTPNTAYDVVTALRRKDSQLWKGSNKTNIATYDYPYCLATPDFVIGEKPRLTFYNPLGREFKFYVISNGVQIAREWTISGKAYEGLSADSTQALLYATIPNTTSANYQIKTVWGDYTWTTDNGNKISVNESACLPIFSDFTYYDNGDLIPNITGDSSILVKNLSDLLIVIPPAMNMVARNGATPSKYIASIDTLSVSAVFDETVTAIDVGKISNKGVLRLTVRAVDSRGLSTPIYKDVTVYDYEKPVINADVKRLNNFESQTTIKVSGTYSRLTLANGADANTIQHVYYRYREKDGAWSQIVELTKTVSNGEYTCNDAVINLDNSKAFEFEILTYDAMGYNTVLATIDVGQAIFFVSSNQKACFINGQKIIMYDVVDTWGGW